MASRNSLCMSRLLKAGHVTWTGLAGCSAPRSAPDSEQLRPASVRRPTPTPSDKAPEYGTHVRDRRAPAGCPISYAATGDRPDVPPPHAGRRYEAPATRFACRAPVSYTHLRAHETRHDL